MSKKDNIFLKLNTRDINTELETILDDKNMDEDVQSLILSMFYKIDNAYSDYQKVKTNMPTKEIFNQNIIDIIEKYVNKIEIIKPTEEENNYEIDIENGKIKCIENESILLFCIFQLIKKSNKEEDLTKNALFEILKYGNSLNNQEVIRAFNGWSWQDNLNITKEIQCNLIYQNLIIIFENSNIQKMIINKNIMNAIYEKLEKNYNPELIKKLIFELVQTSVLIKSNESNLYKIEFESYFKPLNEELNKLENREELIGFIGNKRKEILEQIAEIDKKLNNIKFLKEDFEERNKNLEQGKRFFSISSLSDMYEKEREKLLDKMKEYSKLIEPKSYIKKVDELHDKLKIYNQLDLSGDNNIQNILLNLQISFIKIFERKVELCKEKKNIINLIYQFRYYRLLSFNADNKIKDVIELKEHLENLLQIMVEKAQKLKVIDKFTNSIISDAKIVESILTNDIISLDNIMVQISKLSDEDKNHKIQFWDGNMQIKEIELEIEPIKRKKVKLFMTI